MHKTSFFFLILIVGTGFFLRFSAIDYGLPSKNRALTTYHPDEPLSFYTIEKWKPSELYFHPGRAILWGGFHLFPMAASLKLAHLLGYVKVGPRDFYVNNLQEADKLYKVARFNQILCDTASIAIIFLIVHKLFGTYAGLIASFLYAFSAAQIVNSFNTRPDSMMVFFALLSLFFAVEIWEQSSLKFSILSGIFLGVATATKYSAAPYGIFLVLLHLFSSQRENKRNLIFCLIAIPISFLICSPYVILDFSWFYQQFILNVGLTKGAITPVIPGSGFRLYLTYFLPYAIGCPLTLTGLLGWLWAVWCFIQKRNCLYLVLTISALIVYLVISYPKSQQAWYTLTVAPLFVLFASFFLAQFFSASQQWLRWTGGCLTTIVLGYTVIYSMAVLGLYTGKNVREEVSEWIEKNIPKGERIGIARSYFWTPGILRQYNPPYQLIKGGDDQSYIDDAVLALEKVAKKANVLVLTEYEYRVYLSKKFGNYPKQEKVLKNIMEKEFREIARFEKEAKFLWFRFPKKEEEPYDWAMPNPTIRVFKKITLTPTPRLRGDDASFSPQGRG